MWQHPVAGIVGEELDIPRLANTDQHRVARPPSRFGNAPSLRTRDMEGVSMHVHRMMVHAQVHKANAYAVALSHDERSDVWPCFAIEQQPVVFHAHCVGDGAVRQHGIFLQVN
jgi:hypothetical protein